MMHRGSGSWSFSRRIGGLSFFACLFALLALPAPAQNKPVEQLAEGTANWSSGFTIDSFPTGKYNIYVEGRDKAGNVAVGGPFNVFIDPKSDLPVVHILNPLQGQRVGGDLTIVGSCSDDDGVSKVEVAIDKGPFVEAKGTDLWMLTVDTKEIPDGRRTISVRGTDINGLVGPVVKASFDLDHFKPVVAVSTPVSGALVRSAVRVAGSVSDANGIRDLDLSLDGGSIWSKIDLKRGRDPSVVEFQTLVDSKKLKDGPEILLFRSHDGVGSMSTTAQLFVVANTKPLLAIARPLGNGPVHGRVMVAGSVKDVVGIKRLGYEAPGIGTGEIELRKGDPFFRKDFDTRLIKGDRLLVTLSAEDFAGNLSTFVIDRKIDRQADKPIAAIVFPQAGATVKEGERVFGKAFDEDGVALVRWSVDGGAPTEAKADGSFVLDLPDLASGKHILAVSAQDSFGVVGDPASVSFNYDRGPGSLSFDSLVPSAAKSGGTGATGGGTAGERSFTQGMVVSVDGAETLVGHVSTPNPATRAEWRIGEGPARKLELAKGSGPTDWLWRIPVDSSFPYGFAPVSIELADGFGNVWGGKALLYVTDYASAREETGFSFDEARVEEGRLVIGKDDPFVGIFWREEIASLRLEPPTKLVTASFDGALISVAASGEGRTGPEKIIVTTKKGHEFAGGPFVFTTDLAAPSVSIDSPAQGYRSRSAVQVKGRVMDAGGIAAMSWRALPSGKATEFKPDAGGAFAFSVEPKDIGDGIGEVEVDATDVAGNLGRAYLALGLDAEPPKVDFLSPAPASEISGRQTVVARVSDPSGIASVEYAADGKDFAPVDAPGGWIVADVDFRTSPGASWRLSDRAGNSTIVKPDIRILPEPRAVSLGDGLQISPSDTEGRLELAGSAGTRKVSVLLPLLADQASLDSDSRFGARLLVSGSLSLKGSVTGPTGASGPAQIKTLSLSLDGGGSWLPLASTKDAKSAQTTMAFSFSLDSVKQLKPGPGRLLLRMEDFSGASSYAAIDILVDNAAPRLSLEGPAASGGPITGKVPLIVRVQDDTALASLLWSTGSGPGQELGAAAGGEWFALLLDPTALPKGASLQGNLVARDLAGNSSSLPVKLSYDPAAALPKLEIQSPADAPFVSVGDRISARAQGPEGPVDLRLSIDGGPVAESAGGALAIALPELSPGKHQISFLGSDASGGKATATKDIRVEGRAPLFQGLSIGDGKTKSPLAQGSGIALAKSGFLTGELLSDNGLVGLDCSLNGTKAAAILGKPAKAGDPIPFSLSLAGLPYGKVVARLSAVDSAGLKTSRDFIFVSILPAQAGVDDEDGLRFFDSRIAQVGGGQRVVMGPEESLIGRFNGRPIASVSLIPPNPSLVVANEGAIVSISAKGNLISAPTRVEVRTVDGEVFDWGPTSFYVDRGGPSLAIDSPSDLDWSSGRIRLRGSASDENEAIAKLEYAVNGGEWRALAREGAAGVAPATAAAPSPGAASATPRSAAAPSTPRSGVAAATPSPDPLHWSFNSQIDTGVEDGSVEVSVRAVDQVGRLALARRVFTKDSQAPSLAQVLPEEGEAVNGLTTFIGEARDGGRLVSLEFIPAPGSKPEPVEGLLSFSGSLDLAKLPSPLPDGAGFRAVDAAGNVAILVPKLSVDLQADKPVVQINAPNENEVIRQDFSIAGVAFDDDGISSISYRLDGGEWRDMPIDGMSFSMPVALADTTDNGHSIEVRATDIYGVVGDTVKRSWRVSKEEPFALLGEPPSSRVVSGSVAVSGSASDANGIASMSLSFDNGTSWQGAEGTTAWNYRLDTQVLADGAHAVLLRPLDSYDTGGLAAALLTVDNTPPVAVLDRPLDGQRAADDLEVSGRVSDNLGLASARLEIAPIGAASPALIKVDLDTRRVQMRSVDISSLGPGKYSVRLIARDRAGNETLASRVFEVIPKTSGESVEILYPEPGSSLSGPFTVSGRVVVNGKATKVDVFLDGEKIGEALPGPGGDFNLTLKDGASSEGEHRLSATCEVDGDRQVKGASQVLLWRNLGPWLTIDNFATGAFLPYRPFLKGRAGMRVPAPDPADKAAVAAFRKSAALRAVKSVEVSLDNGRSWNSAQGKENWSFRIETQNYPDGPFFAIAKASFGDGSSVSVPIRMELDSTPPKLEVLSPEASSRQNQVIDVQGTAWDADGIDSVKVLLRKGDKSNYEIPSFVQGLYLDAHLFGATDWEVGAGLTFFGDNVKLQASYGQAPTTDWSTGLVSSFSGTTFGAKLIANLYYLPMGSIFGPDWDWLSMSLGVGADFTYFTVVNGDPAKQLIVSSVFGQLEFPKVTVRSLPMFKKYSYYLEYQVWSISDVSSGGLKGLAAMGVRLGIF